jgi:hypothetical protein
VIAKHDRTASAYMSALGVDTRGRWDLVLGIVVVESGSISVDVDVVDHRLKYVGEL